MKTYTYYIYYIPGVKIGCTTELEKRMSNQGFTNWEILWQVEGDWDFGWTAGNKEQELQREYGLPVDTVHYQISRINRAKGGELRKGKPHSEETRRKISENKKGKPSVPISKEHHRKMIEGKKKKGKPFSEEHRRKMSESVPTLFCQYCGRPIRSNAGHANHEKACKKKQ